MIKDRREAGRKLATKLLYHRGKKVIVLAIPRGGVVVGFEIARKLRAVLDVVIPRKMGAPSNPELAVGAVMHDGTVILNQDVIEQLGVDESYISKERERQVREIERRLLRYRGGSIYPELRGFVTVLVDDGVATGATMFAAVEWIKKQAPASLVVAVPVGPPDTMAELARRVNDVVCLYTPEPFFAIGQFYEDFAQTDDEEVVELLKEARGWSEWHLE